MIAPRPAASGTFAPLSSNSLPSKNTWAAIAKAQKARGGAERHRYLAPAVHAEIDYIAFMPQR
jgi:hypothetical protein